MILIKNAKLTSKNGDKIYDVLLDENIIKKIDKNISIKEKIEIIEAKEKYLLPGLVDLNVRLANSELNSNSLDKLTKTSLRGGVTTSVIMPDFTPRLDSSILLEHFMLKAKKQETSLHVAAPLANKTNEKLNNISTFLSNGADVIWTNSFCNANILKRGFQYARMKKAPIFCKCYEPNLDEFGVMNEGELSFKLGLSGISKISEISEVAKIAEISLINNTKIIFQSLSTKRSIDILKNIKCINKNIYSEVSIHHLCKNETSCEGFNTYAKIYPPLRDEAERKLLIEELKIGNIDILTSAHSPSSVVHKDVAFEDAAFGIGAIEEYLPLCYTYLVKKDIIDINTLMQKCSLNTASILGLEKLGRIEEGFYADMIIFDEKKKQMIDDKTSIYNHEELFGKVEVVFKNGKIVNCI